jgi:hypothetical protein
MKFVVSKVQAEVETSVASAANMKGKTLLEIVMLSTGQKDQLLMKCLRWQKMNHISTHNI